MILNILIICLIIYLLYTYNKKEQFTENFADDTITAINDNYKADIAAIRGLGNVANIILNNKDTLTIPDNIQFNSFSLTDNAPNINIFVQYMIISWGDVNTIPRGWVICDGSSYNIDEINAYLSDITITTISPNNSGTILTPDLRGRFILGATGNDINTDIKNKPITINDDNISMYIAQPDPKDPTQIIRTQLGDIINIPSGTQLGEEYHIIILDEMPGHQHNVFMNLYNGYVANNYPPDIQQDLYTYADGTIINAPAIARSFNTSLDKPHGDMVVNTPAGTIIQTDMGNPPQSNVSIGTPAEDQVANNTKPLNNMPPYYALLYIMKL